jgi:hypothetical protein
VIETSSWSLYRPLKVKDTLKIVEYKLLMRKFLDVKETEKKLHIDEIHNLYSPPSIIFFARESR